MNYHDLGICRRLHRRLVKESWSHMVCLNNVMSRESLSHSCILSQEVGGNHFTHVIIIKANENCRLNYNRHKLNLLGNN